MEIILSSAGISDETLHYKASYHSGYIGPLYYTLNLASSAGGREWRWLATQWHGDQPTLCYQYQGIMITLRPGQNWRHYADDIFNCIFLNENVWIPIKISLKFVPKVQLTIFQHWFRWWLGADQATSHYLNQWWLIYRRIYASLGLDGLSTVTNVLFCIMQNKRIVWCHMPNMLNYVQTIFFIGSIKVRLTKMRNVSSIH